MKEVTVKGQKFMIDDEDHKKFLACTWHINSDGEIMGRIDGRFTLFKRLITEASPGDRIRFIDGNAYNYQKSNLQIMPRNWKRGKVGISGFIGVYAHNNFGYTGWYARCGSVDLGYSKDKEYLAKKYDLEAIRQFGPHAIINFEEDRRRLIQIVNAEKAKSVPGHQ